MSDLSPNAPASNTVSKPALTLVGGSHIESQISEPIPSPDGSIESPEKQKKAKKGSKEQKVEALKATLELEKGQERKKEKKQKRNKELKRFQKIERAASKASSGARSVETLFRNAVRSNLALTALADNKAHIMISVNGFIVTVILTAGGYLVNSRPELAYTFAAVLSTCVASMSCAIMTVRPRANKLATTVEDLRNDRSSILFFKHCAELSADEYVEEMQRVTKDVETVQNHLTRHLHGLGIGLVHKFRWLRWSYGIFTVGLILSGTLSVGGLVSSRMDDRTQTSSSQVESTHADPAGLLGSSFNQQVRKILATDERG